MEEMVKACIITGYGINADEELAVAFERSGAQPHRVHVNDLIADPHNLRDYRIVAFPGGFSFGDHLGSGLVFAGLCRKHLKEPLEAFIDEGNLVIGICNGFQVLVKMGILPNTDGRWRQEVSLIHNESGRFEDRWVRVRFNPASPCVWTRGLEEMELPVRHGEGRFIASTPEELQTLQAAGLDAIHYVRRRRAPERPGETAGPLPYPDNPNGSQADIAGICDPTGHVLGLMPHPEAFLVPQNHPRWTREPVAEGYGLRIFKTGVQYLRDTL